MHSPGSVHLEPVPSPASVSGSTPRRAEISRACAMWENKQVERARQDAAEEGGGQAQGEDPSEGGANEAQPKMTKEPNPMGQRTQPKRPKGQRDGLPRTWSGPSSRRQGRQGCIFLFWLRSRRRRCKHSPTQRAKEMVLLAHGEVLERTKEMALQGGLDRDACLSLVVIPRKEV